MLGADGASLLESTIASASVESAGILASVIGIGALILTASGVFLELEEALNEIWGVRHEGGMLSGLVRARLVSLGLVTGLGFPLLTSLVLDAGLNGLKDVVNARWAVNASLFVALNFVVTLILVAVLFAAIYKLLPAKPLEWSYVIFGAVLTAVLGLLLWIYYSAQIFLFGAAITKAHYDRSRARHESPPSAIP